MALILDICVVWEKSIYILVKSLENHYSMIDWISWNLDFQENKYYMYYTSILILFRYWRRLVHQITTVHIWYNVTHWFLLKGYRVLAHTEALYAWGNLWKISVHCNNNEQFIFFLITHFLKLSILVSELGNCHEWPQGAAQV